MSRTFVNGLCQRLATGSDPDLACQNLCRTPYLDPAPDLIHMVLLQIDTTKHKISPT